MQIAKIIQEPYLLYTGGNGHQTFGIEVENLMPEKECKKRGYSFRWTINDMTLLTAHKEEVMDKLGLSQEEYDSLIKKIKDLWRELDYSLDT